MGQSRHKVRNQVLGPRALAVISCALALLAAQPAMSAPRSQSASTSVKIAGYASTASPLELSTKSNADTSRSQKQWDAATTPAGKTAVHILATVEMLRRLLAFELRPVDQQIAPVLFLEPVAVAVELVSTPPYRTTGTDQNDLSKLSHEQRFSIEQHLLAPPAA